MTDLGESAAKNLAVARPDRVPLVKINPLPPAGGDRAMVRQAFANLLDNAVKFSSRQPVPAIEVTGRSEDGWNVYCGKDDCARCRNAANCPRHMPIGLGAFHRLRVICYRGAGLPLLPSLALPRLRPVGWGD